MKANDLTVAGFHVCVGDLDDIDERKVADLSARISRREYAPDRDVVARKLLSELLGELLL